MPGPIMSAQQAAKTYGLKKSGNKVRMKNSSGKSVEVDKNAKVYHRGNKNFAAYSNSRDKARTSSGASTISKGSKSHRVGEGAYRHTNDGKRGYRPGGFGR